MQRVRSLYLGLLLVLIAVGQGGSQTSSTPQLFLEAPLKEPGGGFGYAGGDRQWLPSRGSVNVLLIFAQFKDEAPGDLQPPSYARELFDPERPGSVAHFYRTMSSGQLQVQSTILPRRYVAPRPKEAYLAPRADEYGGFEDFVRDILQQVDADYDLGQYDNDGPDGVANSGDDDGLVDYIFISMRSAPANFILGRVTGVAQLGVGDDFISADSAPNGEPIRVEISGEGRGAIFGGPSFTSIASIMAHEFAHSLGLIDLFDRSHLFNPQQEDSEYSAGIGRWGLMGEGTLGWQVDGKIDGPVGFSAWSLEQLGWIGENNQDLVYIEGDSSDVLVADLFQGGSIYKIPLAPEITQSHIQYPQYLLLEYRSRSSHYYNRNLPQEGLLIWHVRYRQKDNNEEASKFVDLICADGLYEDAGYPQGVAASHQGRDNLDFWAKSKTYWGRYGGNLGDRFDPFDGRLFDRFGLDTNPSSKALGWAPGSSGLELLRMRSQGDAIVLDIKQPRWNGPIREDLRWAGTVRVDGDLTIAPEGSLTLYPGTQVLVAGTDKLAGGTDVERVEISAEGPLRYKGRHVFRFNEIIGKKEKVAAVPVVFRALVPGTRWGGLSSSAPLDTASFKVRDIGALPMPEVGSLIATAVVEEEAPLFQEAAEDTFSLGANYPNPFTEQTTLPFSLAQAGPTQLTIYNSLGQPVRRLLDEFHPQGAHEIVWGGRDESGQGVANGVYLYQLEVADRFSAGGKMLYLASGFAQLMQLDDPLQGVENAWPALQRQLAAGPRPAYGYAGALAPRQAAFGAGVAWVGLQVARRAGVGEDQPRRDLLRLAPHLDSQGSQQLVVHVERLQISADDALWEQAYDRLLASAGLHGDEVVVYFHLGNWLESLRGILVAARDLGVDLHSLADAGDEAQAGRLFGAYLEEAELADELEELARQLEDNPRGARALDRLLERLEQIAAGIGL